MQQNRFRLQPISAGSFASNLQKGITKFSESMRVHSFTVTTQVGTHALIPHELQAEKIATHPHFTKELKQLVDNSILSPHGLNLQTEVFSMSLEFQGPQQMLPVLYIDWKNLPLDNRVRLIGCLSSVILKKGITESQEIPTETLEAFAHGRALVEDLSAQVTKLGFESIETLKRLESVYLEKANALEANFQKKAEKLELDYSKRNAELDIAIDAHKAEKARFDARENTVVRRELLGKIEAIIEKQKEMKISESTEKKRAPVHQICSTTLAVGLLCMMIFGFRLYTGSVDWHLWLPFTSGLLMFASTAVYYIRWNDNWFRSHAEAEFSNRKFSADMLRASWLAELYFEWDKKKDREMPEQLIQSFSRDLFSEISPNGTKHPFDDINELLKKVSTVKLSKGGLELSKDSTKKS